MNVRRISYGDKINWKSNNLNGEILSNIVFLLYGQKYSMESLSKKLQLHPIVVALYLEYLIHQGVVTCEEDNASEMIEKYYSVEEQNIQAAVYVNDASSIIHYSKYFGKKVEDTIRAIEFSDIYHASIQQIKLDRDHAKHLVEQLKALYELAEKSEKERDTESSDSYILFTGIAPIAQ